MSTVLITGANRGIGLALARLYRERGDTVYGVCRTPSDELQACGAEVIAQVDVTTEDGVNRLREKLGTVKLDLLINNAGILRTESLGGIDRDTVRSQFETNALAPLMLTEALADHLGEGAKVAMITSRMGSVEDNTSGGYYGYRMSKAALNAASKSLAIDLKGRGIAVAILHPGMVSTDMIGGHGDISPEDAAQRLAARIDQLTLQNSGTFWHANGDLLPW
ncbi:SDR family oxidoreductase [Gilvimarinus sp. F26214L]|uniref:SDR family oxidoreductase n=1 Tax=Gilvimarinus sp. DZF01 TaxID=3461371 RepID=UPI004046244C